MANIDTLVEDIYKAVSDGVELREDQVSSFGLNLSKLIAQRLSPSAREPRGTLRMSNVGTPCKRKLWYEVNTPEVAEELTPATRIKFLFGDILEELMLLLAEAAGHTVEGRQDELYIEGVKGHRDAIIDGVLVDVKSASTMGMAKFKGNNLYVDDPFGYLTQLSNYFVASLDDPALSDKSRMGFLVVDKQFGHLVLDLYPSPPPELVIANVVASKEIVASTTIPNRHYTDVEDGKSGNRKLGVQCSYCSHHNTCWPGLRTFLYSNGPRFLTKVERVPDVQEA